MHHLTLSPDQILAPLVPMRDGMDEEALRELAADIRSRGLINPLTVVPAGDKYRLVSGHRRWLAAQEAGLVEIPCVVQQLDDEGEIGAMIAENLHREDPSPLDEARVFAVMHEAFGKTVMEIAAAVHKSREYVGTRLRVLHGPEEIRDALRDGAINLSVALELERCAHDGDRAFLLSHAISGGATASMVSRWVREAAMSRREVPAGAAPADPPLSPARVDVMMVVCEWHRGQVPMEQSLSFRVCGPCFADLVKIRDQLAAELAAEGAAHATPQQSG